MSDPSPQQPQQFWRGNLPCSCNDRDGCTYHNPNRHIVFFDSSLPAHEKPVGGFLKVLKDTAFKAHTSISNNPNVTPRHPTPELWSSLPRSPENCQLLPQIHPSVPYSIAFYHIHTVMTAVRSGHDPSPLLAALTCHGTSGSRPQITWSVTPKIQGGNFLLEHAYAFTIPLKHAHARGHAVFASSKDWFFAEGYKNFAPCRHFVRVFRSVREERKKEHYFAAVDYSLKNVLGQEFKDVWRSDVGRQPQHMCCGMCFCDSAMEFELVGSSVVVRLWVHRDLGSGSSAEDPKWVAGVRGRVVRGREDFGRIRGVFEGGDLVVEGASSPR